MVASGSSTCKNMSNVHTTKSWRLDMPRFKNEVFSVQRIHTHQRFSSWKKGSKEGLRADKTSLKINGNQMSHKEIVRAAYGSKTRYTNLQIHVLDQGHTTLVYVSLIYGGIRTQ